MKKQLVIIMKNPGTSCNIGCVYCAEARKNYISVENKISFEQAEMLANLSKNYSLNVLFHGGEPTLLDCSYYEKMIDIFNNANNDVYFGIQTNGVNLDDRWINLLKINKGKVGISVSLDGPNDINKFRLSKNKEPTFDIVYNNIKKLEEQKIKTGMICTVVSSSLGNEMALHNMLNSFSNLQFVKLNPCMDLNADKTIPIWAVSPRDYFEFVCNFFDIMLKESTWGKFYIDPIISVLKNLQGIDSSFCNYTYKKCFNFISVYPNGTITSCDNYTLEDGYLGKLDEIQDLEKIIYMQNNSNLLNSYRELLQKCEHCISKDICRGGCIALRARYSYNDDYCKGMTMMIKHIKEVYNFIK